MLTQEQNELLTRSDLGTPLGELLRRYWQPVGLSEEVKPGGKPKHVKVMGEDLVLFRDDQGRPGLLGIHCSHRLTSLAYGRVEDGGIRCAFHGWLYDVGGRCLDQPTEPDSSTHKDQVRHLAYPCQELGGLIFAYMGPKDKMPLLPRYEILVREDGSRKADYYLINSNYLQNVEGALDTAHFSFLHMENWSKVKHRIADLPRPQIEFEETEYGIWQKSRLPNVTHGSVGLMYSYFFMPAGFMRVQAAYEGNGAVQKFQSWYVPIDDTHTKRFQVGFAPLGKDGERYVWRAKKEAVQPGPENDYFRNYEEVDTISGIPGNAPGTPVKGFLCQDNMVNESQGSIVDRRGEHLIGIDGVLVAMRAMYFIAIDDVQKGRDPKHIIRDSAQNEIVYVRGTEELELS
jgi:phenylpropionate dioxygenase-like ring-hydroxylating dioxygenase large terminal subunit